MSGLTVSPNGVHIAGSFNAFNADSTEMTPIGNNVFEATIPLDSVVDVQYKYINGNAFGAGLDETVPAACGVNNGFGGYNRYLNVPNTNYTIPTICFSYCVNCASVGINSLSQNDVGFVIAPSVTQNDATILFSSPLKYAVQINLSNVQGKLIEHYEIVANSGKEEFKLSAKNLESGIYFVQLVSENKQATKKLVVIK